MKELFGAIAFLVAGFVLSLILMPGMEGPAAAMFVGSTAMAVAAYRSCRRAGTSLMRVLLVVLIVLNVVLTAMQIGSALS